MFLAFTILLSKTSDPLALPEMQKQLTIQQQFMTLREVVDLVKKETNAPISLSPSVPERKLDILVRDLTAETLLKAVDSMFELSWNLEGKTYYLRRSPESLKKEQLRQAKKNVARRERQDYIKKVVLTFGGMPREKIQSIADQLGQELEAYSNLPEHDPQIVGKLFHDRLLAESMAEPAAYSFASLMFRNPDLWDVFWSGQTVIGSSYHDRLSHTVGKYEREVYVDGVGIVKQNVNVRYAFRNDDRTVDVNFRAQYEDELGTFKNGEVGSVELRWEESPLDVEANFDSWERDKSKEVFTFELKSTPETPSTWLQGCRSLGDHFKWVHDQSKLNIVAESFRKMAFSSELNNRPGPLRDWLSTFREHERLNLTFSDNILQVRHANSILNQSFEPPEKSILNLESQRRELTLSDYATVAVGFTDSQLANYFVLSTKPILATNLVEGYALKFFGNLPFASQGILAAGLPLTSEGFGSKSPQILRQLLKLLINEDSGQIGGNLAQIWKSERLLPDFQTNVTVQLNAKPVKIRTLFDRDSYVEDAFTTKPYKLTATTFTFRLADGQPLTIDVMAPMNQKIADADVSIRREITTRSFQ